MKGIRLLLFEYTHFVRRRSKVLSYLLFVLSCFYAIQNGLKIFQKQEETIQTIHQEQEAEIQKVQAWFEEGKNGPEDRSWVDIHEPYWSLRYAPTYVVKKPSTLLPLGVGQSEQFGFYKEVTFWSSTYDNDMVEEIANPERLGNGNIDFSFLVVFCLPLLLIVMTYDIGGLEKDDRFKRLIEIQFGSWVRWMAVRFAFYTGLLVLTTVLLIFSAAYLNNGGEAFPTELMGLIGLSTGYIVSFSLLYFVALIFGNSSSSNAFNMIGIWIVLCILIPGSVHQYIGLKVPLSYMTEFLDANRKETYAVYSLPPETAAEKLGLLYPTLAETKFGTDSEIDEQSLRKSLSALTNEINKSAIDQIEVRNAEKNALISSTYWFNPVMFVQHRWNSYTSSDYEAYQSYRVDVQKMIDRKIQLLVIDTWRERSVDRSIFQEYLKDLE